MELYIEKAFLDNFYLDYQESRATKGQRVIASILTEYGEVDWFIDAPIESTEDLENLKNSNPFFGLRASSSPPVPIPDFKKHFLLNSHCQQTMIMTEEKQDWFNEATKKGAFCMSFEDYEEIIENFIEKCHLKIDLSEVFKGWNHFDFFRTIPFNKILINDNYILTDKGNQSMDFNIIPLFHQILDKNGEIVRIQIFTKNLNPISENVGHIKEAAKKRYKKLNRELANYSINIRIINNDLPHGKFNLHDRILITNFLSIDSGEGFNLLPHKKSNSQIIVESIFDKYTYKRIKNHLKIYEQYLKKSETLESSKFLMYPV